MKVLNTTLLIISTIALVIIASVALQFKTEWMGSWNFFEAVTEMKGPNGYTEAPNTDGE